MRPWRPVLCLHHSPVVGLCVAVWRLSECRCPQNPRYPAPSPVSTCPSPWNTDTQSCTTSTVNLSVSMKHTDTKILHHLHYSLVCIPETHRHRHKIQTHERLRRMLFIIKKHNKQILRVSPFFQTTKQHKQQLNGETNGETWDAGYICFWLGCFVTLFRCPVFATHTHTHKPCMHAYKHIHTQIQHKLNQLNTESWNYIVQTFWGRTTLYETFRGFFFSLPKTPS